MKSLGLVLVAAFASLSSLVQAQPESEKSKNYYMSRDRMTIRHYLDTTYWYTFDQELKNIIGNKDLANIHFRKNKDNVFYYTAVYVDRSEEQEERCYVSVNITRTAITDPAKIEKYGHFSHRFAWGKYSCKNVKTSRVPILDYQFSDNVKMTEDRYLIHEKLRKMEDADVVTNKRLNRLIKRFNMSNVRLIANYDKKKLFYRIDYTRNRLICAVNILVKRQDHYDRAWLARDISIGKIRCRLKVNPRLKKAN